ncbi:cache domain-containing sensor histidine kinase [Paenibacillus sp. Soil750]|uniref:cache domain-containing sensor histidine kinase n=1 Tax=Paenibacillus sp. Soil750 TaxID=1736398 RepID=UPI0006FCE3BB|nr:sensor histidine kinase [Paenibacillus sp. Soil750]KRE58007.1 hypothetical protein ASL11_30795 [Paenibacillus sp. Soil750]
MKQWSIKFKLLIMTGLLILLSVILVSFVSYHQYTKDFENQSTERVQQIIEQASLNIDNYLDDLSRLSVAPYRNSAVMAALETTHPDSEIEQLKKTRTIEDFLDEIMIIPRNDILTVFVLTDTAYSSGRVQTNIDSKVDFHNFNWYTEALSTQESIFVPAHMQQIIKNPKNKVFSIVRQLRSTKDTEKIIGIIKVDANYSGIEAIGNKVNMGSKGGLFIVDADQNLIFSNVKGGHELDLYQTMLKTSHSKTTIRLDNENYLLNATPISRANWTVVAVNSVAELNHNAVKTRNIAFLMAIISSFLAILVYFFFIKRYLNPLLTIVKLMKEIDHGNLSVTFPNNRHDEIGYLGSSFNEMVHRIQEMLEENTKLVREVYEANFLQKEAQIKALFNQIRPHFIFNTLNMISLLMQSGKEEQAVDQINKLSSLLRGMTNWDKEITLGQEISLLEAYLSIQSSRFGGRLEYTITIANSLTSYYIPALLLQPAVENAVIHGCEMKKEKTIIHIYSDEDDTNLYFYVRDNGIGIDTDKLAKLRERVESLVYNEDLHGLHHSAGTGIGLVNVNKRIKLRYGTEYGLTIDSTPEVGTCVTISLPKLDVRKENRHV